MANNAFTSSSFILGKNPPYKAGNVAARQSDGSLVEFDVVRATTATRVNENGLIESVAANVPRIDYTNGGCGELLVEPQRTNLQTYSEDFTNGTYVKTGALITANNTVAPNGETTADKITINNGTSEHIFFENTISLTAGTYATSVFLKEGNGAQYIQVRVNGSSSDNWAGVIFDITSGTFSDPQSNGSYTLNAYNSETLTNGWYRVSIVTTNSSDTYRGIRVSFSNSATPTYAGFGSIIFTGNNTDNFFAWGAQLEQGSYATSYIPTTASTVTRNQDVISLTGASALLGDSEGGLFVEASWFDVQPLSLLGLNGGIDANRVVFGTNTGKIRHVVDVSSSNQVAGNGSLTITPNTFYKIAARYAVNNYAAYIDGVSDFTDTTLNTFPDSTLTDVDFSLAGGGSPFYGRIRQLVVFDQALEDDELAAITS